MNKYERAWHMLVVNTNFGTVADLDTLKELVDKAIPKQLIYEGDGYWNGQLVYDVAICQNCDRHFEVDGEEHYDYCPSCGQKLDWSDTNA